MNSDTPSPADSGPRRGLWTTLLVVALLWIGLAVGTAVGGWYFLPPGSGLAGPAMALGYGVIGAVAAGVLAGVLARTLPVRLVRGIAIVALLLDAASVAFGAYRMASAQAERNAAAGLDQPLPPASNFVLTAAVDEQDDMRRYREITIDGRTWEAQWIAVGPGAETCTVRLTGAEAAAVETQLGYLESRTKDLPGVCEGRIEPLLYRFRWQRGSGGAPATTVEGGRECLANEPAWSALSVSIGRIPIDAVSHMRVRCERP
jgi:hypothetical protein